MARWRVIGPNAIFGRKTGQILDRELTADQEQALIVGGHLRRINTRVSSRPEGRKTTTPKGGERK